MKGAIGVAAVAAFVPNSLFEPRFADEEALVTTEVTDGFLDVLGLAPQLGRPLLSQDVASGGPPAVVLGYGLWRRRFGAAPDVIGRTVTLGGRRVLVAGVMPRGMDFPWGTNVWVRASPPRWTSSMSYLWLILRISGEPPSRLTADSSPLVLKPLKAFFRPDGIMSVAALYGGSIIIVLIAWLHLGIIQMTQAIDRQRETAMRAVLGADTRALLRRWGLEALLLGIVSLLTSCFLTPAVLRVVVALLPASLTRGQPVAVDFRVVVYLGTFTLAGILALAVGPVAIVRQTRLTDALRGRLCLSGRPRLGYQRIRFALLGLQVGLATAVLYLAATAVHDFVSMRRIDVGFDFTHVLSIEVPQADVPGRFELVSEALRGLPFVIGLAPGTIPLLEGKTLESVSPTNWRNPQEIKNRNALSVRSGPGYLRALGVRIIEGTDVPHTPRSEEVLLSDVLVRRLGLTRPVVGQKVYVGGLPKQVVGVASDIRGDGPDAGPSPFVYDMREQEYKTVVIRTLPPTSDVVSRVVDTVRTMTNTKGPLRVVLASDRYQEATGDSWARMLLLFLIAMSGFALGVIGVFATASEAVRRRARDTAVRLALGQSPRAVISHVIRQCMLISLLGGAAGLAAGIAAARIVSAVTPGSRAVDPLAAMVVTSLLVGSATLASLGPALRAGRSDPLRMLREE